MDSIETEAGGEKIVRTTELVMRDLVDLRVRISRVWEYEPSLAVSANLTNPTTRKLEDVISALEGGCATVAVATGQAAIGTTILSVVSAGSVLLLPDSVYGPVRLFADNQLGSLGIITRYYNPLSIEDLRSKLCPQSKMIWIEAPGSLTFEPQDIGAIVTLAQEKGIVTAIDNTWSTPQFLKPLSYGVDMVVHSLSKLMSGKSEVFAGSVTVANQELYRVIKNMAVFMGHWLSPDDASRVLSGLKDLSERIHAQGESARMLANFLVTQGKVSQVFAPFLPSSKHHQLWRKYHSGNCGLFSFALKGEIDERALGSFFKTLRHFSMSFGWGGPKSLIVPVRPVRTVTAAPKNLIRIYTGLTETHLLESDLRDALEQL